MGKERFFKVFANLPIKLRDEVVLVLPERGPLTWNVAYIEVNAGTTLGDEIVRKLGELQII